MSGLNPGVTTTVQVQAFDVKLNLSGLSTGVPGTTLTDTDPPSAPTNLRVLNGGTTELVLGWNAAVDNGTVTEYRVYADGNLLGTTPGLTLAHSGLTPGSQHTYEVVAKDAAGNLSAPSTTLKARAYTVVLATGAGVEVLGRGRPGRLQLARARLRRLELGPSRAPRRWATASPTWAPPSGGGPATTTAT